MSIPKADPFRKLLSAGMSPGRKLSKKGAKMPGTLRAKHYGDK